MQYLENECGETSYNSNVNIPCVVFCTLRLCGVIKYKDATYNRYAEIVCDEIMDKKERNYQLELFLYETLKKLGGKYGEYIERFSKIIKSSVSDNNSNISNSIVDIDACNY